MVEGKLGYIDSGCRSSGDGCVNVLKSLARKRCFYDEKEDDLDLDFEIN